jgi:hypothetical protein
MGQAVTTTDFSKTEWYTAGERHGASGTSSVGSHDQHVTHIGYHVGQLSDACCGIAVVVREQNQGSHKAFFIYLLCKFTPFFPYNHIFS